MRRIIKTAAAAMLTLAACGQQEEQSLGDIRGVEEIGSPDLTALASGDVSFNSTTGKVTITLSGTESLVIVSKRAADSALLVNGVAQLDTTHTNIAIVSGTGAGLVKAIAVNAFVAGTTVIMDYYNGTFVPGIAPVSPAVFGTAGTVVSFGALAGGSFKVRGSSSADTFYAGQDTHASNPNVLISFSGTNPDIEIQSSNASLPTLGFSLGAGNDTFDATNHKGGTVGTLASAVTVHGGAGNDTMIGGSGADTLFGDEGLNSIDESTGSVTSHTADTVYGLTTATTVTGVNSTTVTYANWANVTTGVTVKIAHLATALIGGVTDNIDDTVGVVIGSPLADTMWCSQLTDMPCVLEGGAGNDTLAPGMSVTNTEYLYGGDGNDTFAMNLIGNHVALIGGNVSDISTTKNAYVDTVDYSAAIAASSPFANSTISMNGTGPATCNVATSVTIPPCIGVADSTPSGLVGAAHTDIRNDVTVAKCPTGANSAGVVCTVKANANGDTVYSGWGSDVLTGGTGDDTFVFADFNGAASYTSGTATKVVTGGGGNDTADFSHHTSQVTVRLDCAVATCDNSGNASAPTAADSGHATAASAAAVTSATDTATLATDFAALTSPAADDTAVDTAADAANTAAQAAATAVANAVGHPGNGADAAAATAAAAAATTAAAASVAANAAHTTGDAGVLSDAIAVATDATAVAVAASGFSVVSESISLVNINNAVCPAGGAEACAVTTNGNADLIDFNSDGAVSGSSLTCNSSSVLTVNASGLTPNCGL